MPIVEKVEAMYLDFLNNYLTVSAFASAYCISEGFARAVISEAQLIQANYPSVASRDEFVQWFRDLQEQEFETKSDRKPPKIDPGFNEELSQAFIDMGLGDMLH